MGLVRSIGIDPGTRSFSVFGLEDGRPFLDEDVPSDEVARDPDVLLDLLEEAEPDIIVGPSGYGLPLKWAHKLTEEDLFLLVLRKPEDKGIPVLEGLVEMVRRAGRRKLPMIFIPSVIQMPTVPRYRKLNRIDMGTADKLAVTVLAIQECSEVHGLSYDEVDLIVVEAGGAYTSLMAVKSGRIVDGIGGSQGAVGYMSHGRMDGEVAYLYGGFPKIRLFEGGVIDIAGDGGLRPEEWPFRAREDERARDAWELFFEEVEKFARALTASVPEPVEVVLSGRLTEVPEVRAEMERRLSSIAPVRKLKGFGAEAKTPAQGEAVIGDGLMGGRYKELVEHVGIRGAKGTVLDYVLIGSWPEVLKRYGVKASLVYGGGG
ncbi:hypothetical protein B6U66_00925 [Candidatus Bathyarchaeota archaeon ex4484_135]|nr:MAG: hypothetical protein B6U66_00925 [Candidatus Bathyarchaeota archaeon ex4484_135]